jgi:hypothetical protein
MYQLRTPWIRSPLRRVRGSRAPSSPTTLARQSQGSGGCLNGDIMRWPDRVSRPHPRITVNYDKRPEVRRALVPSRSRLSRGSKGLLHISGVQFSNGSGRCPGHPPWPVPFGSTSAVDGSRRPTAAECSPPLQTSARHRHALPQTTTELRRSVARSGRSHAGVPTPTCVTSSFSPPTLT